MSDAIIYPNIDLFLYDLQAGLADYTLALNALQNQSRTLTINLENYQYRLQSMQKNYPGSDLNLLAEFSSELYAQKYQRQVASDCENFQP